MNNPEEIKANIKIDSQIAIISSGTHKITFPSSDLDSIINEINKLSE